MLTVSAFSVAQEVTDIHSHNIPDDFRMLLDRHGAALEETFPLPEWNEVNHIAFMNNAGIQFSVLSMPAPQPFYGDSKETAEIIRSYNEQSAKLRNEHPDRFRFCASLPLPDVDAAIREAVYALDTLKADGIKLATNSRGQYLGDAPLDPLMKVLDERGAVIIIHPHKPVPVNENIIATAPLAIYEYPAETTRAVINMISRNVLVRYPNIKVVVPHCGSFLPLAIPRAQAVHPAMKMKGLMGDIDWQGNLRNLYYDLAGAPSPEVIKTLMAITEPSHIMYGSDYPYQPVNVLAANLKRLKESLQGDSELNGYEDMFLWKNAKDLFKIK